MKKASTVTFDGGHYNDLHELVECGGSLSDAVYTNTIQTIKDTIISETLRHQKD